ncbi:hypothetical protein MTBBW1_2320007 [Desulfamplus magnetovallimortis]|uniref:Uncharacterized protein n=1 Tax=Desulfamplus magnetovallimortis TaxID=1246637 RepID=A0A1W1HDL9_9BACT|nr:hypothetical protein MTBBW1_2320007 [Desulfamplus magnetovallimortis]
MFRCGASANMEIYIKVSASGCFYKDFQHLDCSQIRHVRCMKDVGKKLKPVLSLVTTYLKMSEKWVYRESNENFYSFPEKYFIFL